MNMLVPGDEVWTCIVYMIIEIPIYLLAAYYLELVLPSEFGVRLPWYFPFQSISKAIKDWNFKKNNGGVDKREEEMAVALQVDESETKFEDQDVKNERDRVLNRSELKDEEYPLIMRNMRKVYAGRGGQGPKLAVKDVTFAIEEGLIFGLLGPNGAGKTTLISILTGLYETSAGEAKIAGFNVKTESDQVYKKIGRFR
jgi:ABC-type glutathione transport system ATPase component